jgi:hypothetical protein
MIRVVCATCGSKLNAKPELAGQTRKCPKCGEPVTIPETAVESAEAEETPVPMETAVNATVERPTASSNEGVGEHAPERLNRLHQYLICDRARLIAKWENNGQGWLLKTNTGMLPAGRHQDKLPIEGDFRLVELKLEPTSAGHRLVGLASYKLARRHALGNLARGEDAILKTVQGAAGLNREQKNVIRQALHEHFMAAVWQGAGEVLEFLRNTDFHTPGVG